MSGYAVAALVLVATIVILVVLYWETGFEDRATVVGKRHIPESDNPLAEYDAYMTGDDTALFSYFPEEFRLVLKFRGNIYVMRVERRLFGEVEIGDKVTVLCRRKVILRTVRPKKVLSRVEMTE
ncbi:hypothetical protein ACFL26_02065 [Patescibacteria group bacterium]